MPEETPEKVEDSPEHSVKKDNKLMSTLKHINEIVKTLKGIVILLTTFVALLSALIAVAVQYVDAQAKLKSATQELATASETHAQEMTIAAQTHALDKKLYEMEIRKYDTELEKIAQKDFLESALVDELTTLNTELVDDQAAYDDLFQSLENQALSPHLIGTDQKPFNWEHFTQESKTDYEKAVGLHESIEKIRETRLGILTAAVE